ncbi:anaerobic sulfatase maturase [Caldisalinibacter kiritimatiensis]|uniref:Putative arylsulfatase regulator n=1 Tax=Caldisalinibacter kiritimatiensis TaxID=1304284 RepID=R1CN55_9FIRM|nr:anaerobic sulfatase maturase [Caldisalinibacter kiritimatiensis]EOD00141.1 Putative arylsulfatase regulator [Caldisalinibacter kiritimatiensis]
MASITVLIKPSSSSCNMRCKYCFYHEIAENRAINNYGIMNKDTVDILIQRTFEYIGENGIVNFAFQGGEPTLCGIEYFKYFVKKVDEIRKGKNINVNYTLQTNGLLIDDDFAQFFSENNFLLGVSIDGPSIIHDKYRVDCKMQPTHSKVMRAVRILERYNVEFNVLCVVTKDVAHHPKEVYSFFKDNNFRYIQYIPHIDELGNEQGNPFSLTTEDYESFLKYTFDFWYKDFMSGSGISIRYFDNIVDILLGFNPEMCSMQGHCSINMTIESNGNVYPCDFYVLDQYLLGNIKENSFWEMQNSVNGRKFLKQSNVLKEVCYHCEFLSLCRTGCRRHKEPMENGQLKRNCFCEAYKNFFKYSVHRFRLIADTVRNSYN